MSPARWRPLVALLLLAPLSLGLLALVDDNLWRWLPPSLKILARVRLPSLTVCAALYLASGPGRSWRLPRRPPSWTPLVAPSLMWLAGAVVAVFLARVFVPRICGAVDTIAFLGTGLLAEELLFRGAIYQLTARAWPARRWAPLVVSSLSYAVSHLQFHGFAATPAALTQIGYTFALGLVLGRLRVATASVWPGVLLHVLNNTLTVARNLTAIC